MRRTTYYDYSVDTTTEKMLSFLWQRYRVCHLTRFCICCALFYQMYNNKANVLPFRHGKRRFRSVLCRGAASLRAVSYDGRLCSTYVIVTIALISSWLKRLVTCRNFSSNAWSWELIACNCRCREYRIRIGRALRSYISDLEWCSTYIFDRTIGFFGEWVCRCDSESPWQNKPDLVE